MLLILVGVSFFFIMPFLTGLLSATLIENTNMELSDSLSNDLNLSNYPQMFVSNGTFNGYFVVGEDAQAVDVWTMKDIASNMKILSAKKKTNGSVENDVWEVSDGAKLEVANSDTSADSIQGENLDDISSYIGKDELGALDDGTYQAGENSYAYKQYLYFNVGSSGTNELVKYAQNDEDINDIFFFVDGGDNIGQYKLEFSPSAKSDIYDATGAISSSGTILKNFENSKINLLGKEFIIVLARRLQTNNVKLTLMDGAVSGSLLEGETKTYRINDDTSEKDSKEIYVVSLDYVDSTQAKFSINNESTGQLNVGEVYSLANGKEIGVSEILYQDYAGGIHSANFFIGADKLVLKDNDLTDTEPDNEIEVNGKTIDGADVIITGTDDNTTLALSTIIINMTAQNDYYVGAGEKLSEVIEAAGDEKEIIFTNNWDIEFKGLSESKSHEIKLDSSGNRKYKFIFYDGNGNKVSLPLFYAKDDNTLSFGEAAAENCLNLKEGVSIYKDDYFVLTGGDAGSGSAASFALQYKGADKSTATSPEIKFKDLGSGKTLQYFVDTSSTEAGSAVADLKLGGYTFPIVSDEAKTSDNFRIKIEGSDDIDIVDYYGAQVDFSGIPTNNCRNASTTSSAVTITTADSDDYDSQAPAAIVLTVAATTNNEITISSFTFGGNDNPLLGEGNIDHGYTSLGGKITYTSPSGSPNTFTYDYPKKQRLPLVSVTSAAKATGSSLAKSPVTVNLTGATKLDSEINDITAQNLIVVGGACVNTVAAKLLDDPTDCSEGFTSGKAKIRLFKNGPNVAMLVAGYNSTGTRLAGKVIAHRWTELFGNEVEIEGKTYNDATITVPATE